MSKARDIADIGSNDVLETTSTGVDVTGTVTADGATFDGYVTVNNSMDLNGSLYPDAIFMLDSKPVVFGSDTDVEVFWGGSYLNLQTKGNDIRIMDGLDTKVIWDASAESLGIGTTTVSFSQSGASQGINLVGSTNSAEINLTRSGASSTGFLFVGANDEFSIGTDGAKSLNLRTNNTERMRIDSSGNLLVGKTSADDGATAGLEAQSSGALYLAKNAPNLYVNRLSTDGEIIRISKDGTNVGSIATNSGRIAVCSGDRGLGISGAVDAIFPTNGTGNASVNDLSLGTNGLPFKDLYLSGGVYLGGTGSANYLEDYEEGTWTPNIAFGVTSGSSATYNWRYGTYVKVGKVVHCQFALGIYSKGTATGTAYITGLPFTTSIPLTSNWLNFRASGYGAPSGGTLENSHSPMINVYTGRDYLTVTQGNSMNEANETHFASGQRFMCSFYYYVD